MFILPRSSLPSLGLLLERERVRLHLRRAETRLRAASASHLSEHARLARQRQLARLRDYRKRGVFPHNYDRPGRRFPCFIDPEGRACAVAHLLNESGHQILAEQVAATLNHAYVREMQVPELAVWAEGAGLTVDELALIQPSYGDVPSVPYAGPLLEIARLALGVGILVTGANVWALLRERRAVLLALLGLIAGVWLLYFGFVERGVTHEISPSPPDVVNPFGEWDVLVGFVAAVVGLAHLLMQRRPKPS